MIQRWKLCGDLALAVREPDGDYVEYADHLAAIAEKDKEIESLKAELKIAYAVNKWEEDGGV